MSSGIIMEYIGIGLIVGIIMGLTGAGGAMISIPLFIHLLNSSIQQATTLSLLAVVFGTLFNLIGQISQANKKIIFILSASGALTNYISLPIKESTPDIVVAGLLSLIGIYGIKIVWKKKPLSSSQKEEGVFWKSLLFGILLGLITTLTGLGGGVVLVPILIKFFGKSYEEALPTSLGSILLVSLTAFIFQFKTATSLISLLQMVYLIGGSILSFILLKSLLPKINKTNIDKIRKLAFTLVTIYSTVSIIIKAL